MRVHIYILVLLVCSASSSAFSQSNEDEWDPKLLANEETASSLFELGGFPQTSMARWRPELFADGVNDESEYGQPGTNTFGAVGNCTWYVFGRVHELRNLGLLNHESATNVLNKLHFGPRPRHAKNWDDIIGGNWQHTSESQKLDKEYRKPGTIVVWDKGNYGHVGFIEEVSADGKSFRLSHFNWWNCANKGELSPMCDFKQIGRLFSTWMSYDDDSTFQLKTYPKFLVID